MGNRQGEAASLGNLGNAYYLLGQYKRAINLHQQSLTIAQEIGDRQGEASSLGSLGILYDALVELYSRPGETDVQLADRFRQWCESRPSIAQAVTNKICTAAAGRTTSNPSAETVRKSDERLKSNTERLISSPLNKL
ncbi:hypothetical protein BI308_24890 [Roseofilum reptotaenium AO1-A]|uniref:Uncharacterized protein n=2 Tax=Roseofilum TaxID=1233426 RepID=A0A1L9QJX9_9CYAN|nr:hypothetical protein BI308_24890 [Roseofilum reptotaenium AO1-A]